MNEFTYNRDPDWFFVCVQNLTWTQTHFLQRRKIKKCFREKKRIFIEICVLSFLILFFVLPSTWFVVRKIEFTWIATSAQFFFVHSKIDIISNQYFFWDKFESSFFWDKFESSSFLYIFIGGIFCIPPFFQFSGICTPPFFCMYTSGEYFASLLFLRWIWIFIFFVFIHPGDILRPFFFSIFLSRKNKGFLPNHIVNPKWPFWCGIMWKSQGFPGGLKWYIWYDFRATSRFLSEI